MSSIGVVVFRNSPIGRAQVLKDSVTNCVNISNNNDANKSGKREIIILRKKQKVPSSPTVSVTSLVRAADSSCLSAAKRPRVRDDAAEEQARTPTPLAVARRNARERNRVRRVNDGFAALRRHIPEEVAAAFENANSNRGPNKKLSKVETLRMAVEYIRNLETLLDIGHGKENASLPSMESYPSPASSSPRDNSQERSYFSLNSPALDDDDLDDDELDGTLSHIQHHHYITLPAQDFQLVSTPHLYEEEDGGPPLTPSSDLLAQEDVSPHLLEGNFQFPNSAEQFTVIPEQSYCSESEVPTDSDFEIKYSDSLHPQLTHNYNDEVDLPLDAINADMILDESQYKFKEVNFETQQFTEAELKKELPDIQVTPEDREQFEETLKWWQEKTKQARPLLKNSKI